MTSLFMPLALAAALVTAGKPVSVIRTECNAKDNIQIAFAAQDLTNWVCKITGAAIPVDPAGETKDVTTVYLGTPDTSKTIAAFAAKHADDFKKLGDYDGFVIAEEGGFLGFGDKTIYIAAKRTKGVLNGVYRFLERNSDIIFARQYHGDDGCGTIYSKTPDFENGIDKLVDVPAVHYRWWTANCSRTQPIWQARILNNIPSQWNDKDTTLRQNAYHEAESIWRWFTPGRMYNYKDTDPDIFPLIDGERKIHGDPQLCFGNPKSADLFAAEIAKQLKKAPRELKRVMIALGDNNQTCCCPDYCLKGITLPDGRKLLPKDKGFRTTQFALFVNKVSDLVRAECPWVEPISIQNYIFTAEPPLVQPVGRDNQFCPYVKNHKKPVYDTKANPVWASFADGFKKLDRPVSHVYEYYLCGRCSQYYHAICEVAQADLKYYYPHLREMYNDVVYCDDESKEDRWGWRKAYDASAIEYWVLSRLMWNPFEDVKALRREYCRRAYREAGDVMADYYETLARDYNEDPAACLWNDDAVVSAKYYIVDKKRAAWLRETLAKAEAAAVHPGSKELIRLHRVQMEDLVAKAEKMPNRVELGVPNLGAAPDSLDPESAFWKKAAKAGPFTEIKKANEVHEDCVRVRVAHDLKKLYVLTEVVASDKAIAMYKKAKAEDKMYLKADTRVPYDWSQFEYCIDGRLKESGSYYFCPFMVTGRSISGIGTAPKESERVLKKWDLKVDLVDGKIRALNTWDLDEIGVEVTKDPKVNVLFLVNFTVPKDNHGVSWNGSYWHAQTSFQTLRLDMR